MRKHFDELWSVKDESHWFISFVSFSIIIIWLPYIVSCVCLISYVFVFWSSFRRAICFICYCPLRWTFFHEIRNGNLWFHRLVYNLNDVDWFLRMGSRLVSRTNTYGVITTVTNKRKKNSEKVISIWFFISVWIQRWRLLNFTPFLYSLQIQIVLQTKYIWTNEESVARMLEKIESVLKFDVRFPLIKSLWKEK